MLQEVGTFFMKKTVWLLAKGLLGGNKFFRRAGVLLEGFI